MTSPKTGDPLNNTERTGWTTDYEVPWHHIVGPALDAVEPHDDVGNYSQFIYRIIDFLRAAGVTLHEHAHDLPVAGRVGYEPEAIIWLNAADAQFALLTIAHEAGHLVGYWRHRKNEPVPDQDARERYAMVYGWVVLRWVGAAPGLVSKAHWVSFDDDSLDWDDLPPKD